MKKINPDHLDIRVDTKRGKIYFTIAGDKDAQLRYTLHEDGKNHIVEFTQTYVPEPLRHMGIGTKLVEKGMEFAQANHYLVDPVCPFVEAYLDNHPEFKPMRIAFA